MLANYISIDVGKWESYKRIISGQRVEARERLIPLPIFLVAEGLNVMLVKIIQMIFFDAYQFGKGEVKLFHIQYANDTIVVGKRSWKNIWAIKEILQLFELISDLKKNFNKSSLISLNILQSWLEKAAKFLNYKVDVASFKYLVLPVRCNHQKEGQ